MKDIVINYLYEETIKVMLHPPYLLDLVPPGFWLFNYFKDRLVTYSDAISLAKTIVNEFNSILVDEYKKTFQK